MIVQPPSDGPAAWKICPSGRACSLGWTAAIRHTVFVLLLVVLLVEAVVLTIDHVPFTRPYKPGHAKLKTRWPLYALSAYGFGYGLARTELAVWANPIGFVWLLASVAAAIAALEIAGWWRAAKWSVHARDEEVADDAWNVTVLDIGSVVQRAHVEG